ncbi:MAG: ThuA domain-containing protein [Armatimonadetes bacterium]|nr:ThuA domain-containing protein [Armatimonadota bacterium]
MVGLLAAFLSTCSSADVPRTALAVEHPRVLAFSKTAAFRHDSIPDGHAALQRLAKEFAFTVSSTEDASVFTDDGLGKYDVVLFLSTTGDVLNEAQQAAMERFIRKGKGYVGIHAASDTEYDWPWYGRLVGAYFKTHGPQRDEQMKIFDRAHPTTSFLPSDWKRFDEWYEFRQLPADDVTVLFAWDEGAKTGFHPVSWYHEFDGGRAFYNAMGHTKESFVDPLFPRNVSEGIFWAANARPPQGAAPPAWKAGSGWRTEGGALTQPSKGKDLSTKAAYGDLWVHAEYKIPAKGNSGVYLQGRYEVQIADSHGSTQALDFPDAGGLMYGETKGHAFAGQPPLSEASKAAGQWNTLDVLFRAPRFDPKGRKTMDARFVEVRLNGVVVQKDAVVSGPSKGAGNTRESATGPLVLQGSYGPVDFRNVLVKPVRL